jgi:hypothetical protein
MVLFLHNLNFLAALATLYSSRRWAVEVALRNPALVVSLLCHCSTGNSWSISTNNRDLILWINCLLAACRRTLSALATFASTFQLWEESLDPGLVDKVEGSTEGSEEDKVKEDAGGC